MNKSNQKKAEQLGMPWGTACNKLRKKILFQLLVETKKNRCYHCREEIAVEEELSIEHKIPWLDDDPNLFWHLSNIAFSHLSCNCSNGRKHNKGKVSPHGHKSRYRHSGCRCKKCCKANTDDCMSRRYSNTEGKLERPLGLS